jgi:hypothetical protein
MPNRGVPKNQRFPENRLKPGGQIVRAHGAQLCQPVPLREDGDGGPIRLGFAL